MALTPEDVVNKRFQPTKFREGYDQDEVDDFLDEVVVEFRKLTQENEDLRQHLAASQARVAELESSESPAPQLAPVAVVPEPEKPVIAESTSNEADNATNLLQLARRLHEEHVREGLEKRDSLIAEGHATAAKLVSEAEAQQKANKLKFEQEQAVLEQSVEELRAFEQDYRAKLKSYIEGQLQELESTVSLG